MIRSQAWILDRRPVKAAEEDELAVLRLDDVEFSDLEPHEVLVEPLFGSWEGNMDHAVRRRPVDICVYRGEPSVIVGNSGVLRIVETGRDVKEYREGDLALLYGNAESNEFGFMVWAHGYDARGSVGLLCRRLKLRPSQMIPLRNSRFSPEQWAAFPCRYPTAWANWKVAHNAFCGMLSQDEYPDPWVWGWGGGTTYAELLLAKRDGCRTAMCASAPATLEFLEASGIRPIDRKPFGSLEFPEDPRTQPPGWKAEYDRAEKLFLEQVADVTSGRGVSIFVDYIGQSVLPATVKAMGHPAVLTSAGWKSGLRESLVRSMECMKWHVHVFTHYARRRDVVESVNYAESTGWLPPPPERIYRWEEIPLLAADFAASRTGSYFPVYRVCG